MFFLSYLDYYQSNSQQNQHKIQTNLFLLHILKEKQEENIMPPAFYRNRPVRMRIGRNFT